MTCSLVQFGQGAAPFTPNKVGGGAALWTRSDLGVSLDGSSNVQTWADQSGLGNNLAQVTAGNRPGYSVNGGVNGLPYLSFDYTKLQGLVSSGNTIALAVTDLFVVLRVTSESTGNDQCPVALGNATSGQSNAILGGVGNGIFFIYNFGTVAGTSVTLALNQDSVLEGIINGTAASLALDGGTEQSGTTTAISGSGFATVGGDIPGIGNDGFAGWIYEVVAYASLLSSSDRAKLLAYFTGRYGIAT